MLNGVILCNGRGKLRSNGGGADDVLVIMQWRNGQWCCCIEIALMAYC